MPDGVAIDRTTELHGFCLCSPKPMNCNPPSQSQEDLPTTSSSRRGAAMPLATAAGDVEAAHTAPILDGRAALQRFPHAAYTRGNSVKAR